MLALVAVAAGAAGCGVNTGVDLTVRSNGSGTVGVTVSLDRAAQTEVGNLASQLQTSDLAQAGWTVTGPRAGPDGTEVVSATKPFADPPAAGADVASLAGTGPVATRPFRLVVDRRHTFWHTVTTVSGTVDLSCGVGCFGDAGLQHQFGSSVGVNPGAISAQSGETAAQALAFSIVVHLPGPVRAAAPAVIQGDTVTWKPVLGQSLPVAASTRIVNEGTVATVVVAGIVAVLVIVMVVAVVVRRQRRDPRRSSPRHRKT